MESWRIVFRHFAQLASRDGLEAILKALEEDDPRLIQGNTTSPPPLPCLADFPCESCCLVSFAGWQGDNLDTVVEVEEFFARMCFTLDKRLGEPGGCRWLLNWYDETERQEVRQTLIPEVRFTLGLGPDPLYAPAFEAEAN